MRCASCGVTAPCPPSPLQNHLFDQFGHCATLARGRAEVPGIAQERQELSARHPCTEKQICAERFNDMLPRADGGRIAYHQFTACLGSANEIRNNAVCCPIAATDDVASPDGSDA